MTAHPDSASELAPEPVTPEPVTPDPPVADAPVPLFLPLLRERRDPDPDLARLRRTRPVARLDLPADDVPPVWLVCGYDEVRRVLGDAVTFSNDLAHLAGTGLEALAAQDPGGLGFTDPPDHTRLRRILTPEFTARALQELAPRVEAVVAARIDALVAQGPPADLVADFAVPVPSAVICELLGVPEEDRAQVEGRSAARFDVLGSLQTSLTAVHASLDHLTDLVARCRVEHRPGLLSRLVAGHGDLSDRELAALADGLLTGGHETTATMLALGVLALLEEPGPTDGLRSGDIAVAPFVEELLRHLSVVQVAFPRFARAATTVGGVPISAGDVVICSLSGANRDRVFGRGSSTAACEPTVTRPHHDDVELSRWSDPERLDPGRRPVPHLAFGYGVHRCLGAELGRIELRAAIPALLRRLPGLRLAVPADQVEFRTLSLIHGLRALPVTW